MQHPELSHPKFLLRYLKGLGVKPRSSRSDPSTRFRPEGHSSESRRHRDWEWRQLRGKEGKEGKEGKGGKGKGGKDGKDDKGKGGKGGKGRKQWQ